MYSVTEKRKRVDAVYYFLGLVTDKDMKLGRITPSFVLGSVCQQSILRAPWRVFRIGGKFELQRRVLATSLIGNDLMIDFMSYWRALTPKKKRKATRRVYVRGALFFFECNRYGNRINRGRAFFIKRVPDRIGRFQEDNWYRYKMEAFKTYTIGQLLSREPRMDSVALSGVKPRLMQTTWKSRTFYDEQSIYTKQTKERNENGKRQLTARRRVPAASNNKRKRTR